MALTPKQQRFVEEYLVNLQPGQAYRRAGYKVKTDVAATSAANRLLSNVEVSAAIATAQAQRSAQMQIDQKFVLTRLKENLERAMQASQPKDKEGNPAGDWRWDGAVANKALELLGKHLGMFKERVEHTGAGGGPIQIRLVCMPGVEPDEEATPVP